MFEYLMLGDVRARKYSKTGARTRSILEKFAFDTTLVYFKGAKSYVPAIYIYIFRLRWSIFQVNR